MQVHNLKYGLSGDIEFAQYATGETAIRITGPEGLIATATVNIEEWGAPPAPRGRIWVKTWSENAGMDEALIAAGVCEPFSPSCRDVEVYGGYGNSCVAVSLRLTPAALAELETQER